MRIASCSVVVDEKTPPQEIALSSGATIAGIVRTTSGVRRQRTHPLERTWPGLRRRNEGNRPVLFQPHASRQLQSVGRHERRQRRRTSSSLGQDENKEGITLIVGAGRSVRGMVRGLPAAQLQSS